MHYFRSVHGAPTDPKWQVVARRAKASRATVIAVWWAMLDYASQHEDRGSIAGFDAETFAVFLDCDTEEVAAVVGALRDKEIITDDDRIAKWDKHQPKREGDHSTPRVRECRDRKKQSLQSVSTTPETPRNMDVSGETHGNARKRIETPIERDRKKEIERDTESANALSTGAREDGSLFTQGEVAPKAETPRTSPKAETPRTSPKAETPRTSPKVKAIANAAERELFGAFRAVRYGTDSPSIPEGEFNRALPSLRPCARDGITPDQMREATATALRRFSSREMVTLRSVLSNWSALLEPDDPPVIGAAPNRRGSSAPPGRSGSGGGGPQKETYAEKFARLRAKNERLHQHNREQEALGYGTAH